MKPKCKTVVIEVETVFSNSDLKAEVLAALGGVDAYGDDVYDYVVRSIYVKTDQPAKPAKKKRAKP